MTLSGRQAEEEACRLLKEAGYKIVARNWRCRYGEIDIIARDGATLVFVEVKARSGDAFGGAGAAVDVRKQRRIAITASLFLEEMECMLPSRFDVVAFSGEEPALHRDAFRLE
jgi:putative endonuclease